MPSTIFLFFAYMIIVLLAIAIIVLLIISPVLDTGEQDICAKLAALCFVLMMIFSFIR